MVEFNTLKPGQIVWRKVASKQGGTRLNAVATMPVKIIQIDPHLDRVQAQWGTNPPRWFGAGTAGQWRRNRPRGLPEAVMRRTLKATSS